MEWCVCLYTNVSGGGIGFRLAGVSIFFVLSRGLEGEETGEGTGICPRAVLCVACVRVLNGSFSASFLVKGVRTDVLVVVVVVVVVETQKMRCWVSVKKEKE